MSAKDIFGFDEALPASAVPDDMLAADDKTLRLAAPWVDAKKLEGFLRYQRAVRDRLGAVPVHGDRAAHVASAHTAALELSGLTASDHAQLGAFANDFCGRRSTVRLLASKLDERRRETAEIEARGDDVPQALLDVVAKLASELARLDTYLPMERRYGQDAVAQLRAREDELLELHAEVTRLVSRR